MSNIFVECFDTVFEEFNNQTSYNESVFSKLREDAIFNLCKYFIDGKYIQNINNDYLLLKHNNLNKYSIEKLNDFYLNDDFTINGHTADLRHVINELQVSIIDKLSLITSMIKSSFEFSDSRSYVDIYPNLFDFEYEKDLIININETNKFYLLIQTIINSITIDHFPSRVNETDFNIFRKKVNTYFVNYLGFQANSKWYVLPSLVKAKCLLLINKHDLRKVADSIEYNNFFNTEKKVSPILVRQEDGTSSQFNSQRFLEASNRSVFEKFNKYILNHYELNVDFKDEYLEDKQSFINEEDLLSSHKQIKLFKDVEEEDLKSRLDSLKEIIKKKYTKYKSLNKDDIYGKFSNKLAHIYSIGNYFSLYIQQEQSLEKIHNEYNELTEICIKYNYFNYFLISKLIHKIKCIFESINISLSENQKLNDIDIKNFKFISDKKIKLDDIYKTYKSNRNWVKHNLNYLYLIEFQNSFIDYNNVGKIYIYSSYFLPVSLNELKYKTEAEIKYIENHYLSIKNYLKNDDEVKTIRIQFEETKQKLETKELESLKVIFSVAGILTFVAGSVQGFQFINTYTDFLFFFAPFGLTIALITSLIINYINNKITKERNNYYSTIIIGFLLCINLFVQMHYSSTIITNSIDQEIIKENRINEIIKERDSLIKSNTEIKKALNSTKIIEKNKIDSSKVSI